MKTDITLDMLVGKHKLSGVDFDTINGHREWDSAHAIIFILDGVTYIASEDPCDDYRSCMQEIKITTGYKVKNRFKPVEVVGSMQEDGDYGETNEVLQLIDTHTGKVVLEVGTHNSSDYYPSYVAAFHPENMWINRNKKEEI